MGLPRSGRIYRERERLSRTKLYIYVENKAEEIISDRNMRKKCEQRCPARGERKKEKKKNIKERALH